MQEVVEITASGPLHSFANIINYIYSKFHNDLACIWAVMDQNRKQCTDFAVYFYQIRWFDITAFASKAPKVQEVVKITASGPPPFVCKYYKLFIQQISQRYRLCSGREGPECETMYRLAVYFYQIRWFDITAFASKAPKVQEVVEIPASVPPLLVCKYYKLYIQQIS